MRNNTKEREGRRKRKRSRQRVKVSTPTWATDALIGDEEHNGKLKKEKIETWSRTSSQLP